MTTLIEADPPLYCRAEWGVDLGEVNHTLMAMVKWFCGENAVSVVDEASRCMGCMISIMILTLPVSIVMPRFWKFTKGQKRLRR